MKKHLPIIAIGVVLITIFWGEFLFGNSVLYDMDIHTEYVPLQTFLTRTFAEGGKGWWNPFSAMGTPLLADGHAGIYYLPAMFYRWLGADPSFLSFFLAVHLLYCFVFACLLAREFGAGKTASVLAGVLCAFSGYQTAIVSTFLYALAITHTPALFYFLLRLLKSGQFKYGLVLGLIFSQQFCVGYFPFTFNTLVALLLFFCFAVNTNEWKLWTKPLVLSGIVGIVFSLPQLLPTLEFIPLSAFKGGVKLDYMVSNSLSPKLLLSYFFPLIWGTNVLSNKLITSDIEQGYFDFDELHNYLGLLPLFFAFVALTLPKSKIQRSILILGITSLILSLGTTIPGIYQALVHVPGFNYFKDPAKWSVHFNLMITIFAAIGLDQYLNCPNYKKLSFFLIPIVLLIFIKVPLIQFTLILIISIVLLFLPLKREWKSIVIIGFIFLELFYVEAPLVPREKPDFYNRDRLHLHELKNDSFNHRSVDGVMTEEKDVLGLDHLLADVGTFHGISTLTVTSPFVTKDWSRIRDWAEERGMEDLQRFNTQESLESLTPLLKALNVGWIINKDLTVEKLSDVRPRAYFSSNQEAILTETFNLKNDESLIPAKVIPVHSEKVLISVETGSSGILVYQDQYYPGWKAFVNGKEAPVLKANGIFKAVKIDKPGKFEVEFLFRPSLYVWTGYLFWFCWLVLAPLMIIFLIKVSRDENHRNNLSGL